MGGRPAKDIPMNNLDYGMIGNCRSGALVSRTGSIDWCCLPEFDSSSVFANLLDKKIGGRFAILADGYSIAQEYLEDTSILITAFDDGANAFEIRDFMPRYLREDGTAHAPPEIVRYIKVLKGRPVIRVDYDPRLEYALNPTATHVKQDFIVSLTDTVKFDTLFLYSSFDLADIAAGNPITVSADGFFLVGYNEKIFRPTTERIRLEFERTKVYWMNWSDMTPVYQKYNAQIRRSAITLKLLSYEKTGAILAAATTSLPETLGEVRNWDYRFCWVRDASMVIKVLSTLGHKQMAQSYLQFIVDLIPDKDEKLQIMYGINKEKILTEEILGHLSGYEGSAPVRIGNAAYTQKQNDIYGILMDVIHQQFTYFNTAIVNGEDLWNITKGIVWVVSQHWQELDKGIWELRTESRHFTFSKVLCWTAIDRAAKVAIILGKTAKAQKWQELADAIKVEIHDRAWNEQVGAFTQSYGSTDLDASVLLMETYGFIGAREDRFVSTVRAIGRELSNDGLLYRYKNRDDFGLPSSSFTICTFWYINSLYKIGNRKSAESQFEKLLGYANHLGLFSEDIDFSTKRLLGNFPQAYSHLALVETAITLSSLAPEEEVLGALEQDI